ncbi:MAG: ParM/StbA family protein [Clostridiaceae bacterium]|nr:ParM/StbA family protein [Clostridiaceae bacterium]
MYKPVVVACDTGNDTIKVKVNKNIYFIPTIMKSNPRKRLIFGSGDEGESIDFLDVTVESRIISGVYHVGNLARYGINQESLGGVKSENKLIMVCMLTAIAYALAMEYPSNNDFSLYLGAGLPVSEFFWQNEEGEYDFSKVEKYKETIAGIHRVKFNTNLLNNRTITIEITPERLAVIPEGYAALTSILMSDDIDPDFRRYTRKNAIAFCMDIGSISCDVSSMMNGKYFPAGMFGFDMGMSSAIDSLCIDIRNRTGIKDITRYEVNTYLFDKELNGIYKTNKVEINLNQEKIPHYKKLAETIAYRFREKLKENGVDIRRINVLFLVGGGSIELGDYVFESLKNDISEFVGFEAEEALTKNLLGYEIAAKKLLND